MKSIANPNILEVSLNRAYSEIRNSSPPSASASASSVSPPHLSELLSLLAREFSALPLPTLLPHYSRSGCLCKPCVTVVTVNRVQSTYDVPTYGTAGGDIHALNSLCKSFDPISSNIQFYFDFILFLFHGSFLFFFLTCIACVEVKTKRQIRDFLQRDFIAL